jgi:hypothetical protein
MHFLRNLTALFKFSLGKIWTKKIPLEINYSEIIVRGVFHPFFYSVSKGKLKREAFLPPPDKNDVSVLRHDFTEDDFCKDHCKSLNMGPEQTFCGLATFCAYHIEETNQRQKTNVELSPTPMPGLPMHASILYEEPINKAGVPNTAFREYANKLKKRANYFNDPDYSSQGWKGNILGWIEENAEEHPPF